MNTIEFSILRAALSYDPETGIFTRLSGRNNGGQAGTKSRSGYIDICVKKRMFRAHRLAWAFMHNVWPELPIDHINGDRADNRIANLRLATMSQNVAAGPIRATNKCGYKGVNWHRASGKWMAQICVNGRKHYLGIFDTPTAAHDAYMAANKRLYGEFAPQKVVEEKRAA